MSRHSYGYGTCRICGISRSSGGWAVTAHERGKVHIAALRAKGNVALAERLQYEADTVQANRRRYKRVSKTD